jgi:hypothetical protein
VLRVALLTGSDRATFSLVRNISSLGIQVKLFGQLPTSESVQVRIADEDPIPGRIAWVKDSLAGIEFDAPIEPETILRLAQKKSQKRRRASPRMTAMARGLLRTNGRTYAIELRDIGAFGAKIRTSHAIKCFGPSVMLVLPDLPPIKAFVRWTADDEMGLAFQSALPIQIIAAWVDSRIRISA